MLIINYPNLYMSAGGTCCSDSLLRASGQQMAQLDLTPSESQGHCSSPSSHWSSSSSDPPWMLLCSVHCAAAWNPCVVTMMRRQMCGGNPLFTHVVIHYCKLNLKNQCSPSLTQANWENLHANLSSSTFTLKRKIHYKIHAINECSDKNTRQSKVLIWNILKYAYSTSISFLKNKVSIHWLPVSFRVDFKVPDSF